MLITYIGHSGFLIEWENCYWLFDYFQGEIPVLDAKKKLIVFSSHKHGDHFNPQVFQLYDQYPKVEYVLSSDIRIDHVKIEKQVGKGEIIDHIVSVKPHQDYQLRDEENKEILLHTLKSTDCGVAFLLKYQGRTIYHAGDLNHWIWREETKQSNNDMTAKFNQEMLYLQEASIDIAFVPLDPRQEDWYYLGLEKLLNTAKVRYAFPMHFWDKPEIVQTYKQERSAFLNGAEILEVSESGQSWKFEL